MASLGKTVEILITGNSTQAVHEIEKLVGTVDVASQSMTDRVAAFGKAATIALAAGSIAVGAFSVKMANDFDQAHARLVTSLKNIGSSFTQVAPQVTDFDNKMEKLGFTNAQTQDAISRSILATKNLGVSEKDISIAADLARARHMDLNSALQLVTRAGGGTYTALLRLGIVTKDQAKNFKDGADAVDFLAQKYKGQASAAADTFAGKIGVVKAQAIDLGVRIGNFLIPIIEDLIGAIEDTINWFEQHKAAAIALAAVIAGVLTTAISVFVYQKIAAFVDGIQTMVAGLGRLLGASQATAAGVAEAGAEVEAAGAGAADSTAAVGAGAGAAIAPLALLTGGILAAAFGMEQIFGSGGNVQILFKGLASNDIPALTNSIEDNNKKIDDANSKISSWGEHISAAKINHQEFNTILEKSPQDAQAFIDAIGASGQSTAYYTQKLQEHIVAATEASVAQQRFALQMQIAQAQAQGNAQQVYGLTLQLNALPTNKQIEMRLDPSQVLGAIAAIKGAVDGVTTGVHNVVIGITGAGSSLYAGP